MVKTIIFPLTIRRHGKPREAWQAEVGMHFLGSLSTLLNMTKLISININDCARTIVKLCYVNY